MRKKSLGHLATNMDEQKKLLKELHFANIYALEDLDFETLHKLSRLHAVFYEFLRLVHPSLFRCVTCTQTLEATVILSIIITACVIAI